MLQTHRLIRLYFYSLRVRKCRSHRILCVLLFFFAPPRHRSGDSPRTCSDISMSTRSFLMPIQTLFPLSWCAMLARSLSVKLPSSYGGKTKGDGDFHYCFQDPPTKTQNKERAPLKTFNLWTMFIPLTFFQSINIMNVVFFSQSLHKGYKVGSFEAACVHQCVLLRKGSGGV